MSARVSNIPIHQSHKQGRPLPPEKNEPCPMRPPPTPHHPPTYQTPSSSRSIVSSLAHLRKKEKKRRRLTRQSGCIPGVLTQPEEASGSCQRVLSLLFGVGCGGVARAALRRRDTCASEEAQALTEVCVKQHVWSSCRRDGGGRWKTRPFVLQSRRQVARRALNRQRRCTSVATPR